jgi:hypothetical protein
MVVCPGEPDLIDREERHKPAFLTDKRHADEVTAWASLKRRVRATKRDRGKGKKLGFTISGK